MVWNPFLQVAVLPVVPREGSRSGRQIALAYRVKKSKQTYLSKTIVRYLNNAAQQILYNNGHN